MTREESWNATGVTLALLQQIASAGYTVSVFRFPESMLGASPANIAMHAIDVCDVIDSAPRKHVARVTTDEHADPDYACGHYAREVPIAVLQNLGITLDF